MHKDRVDEIPVFQITPDGRINAEVTGDLIYVEYPQYGRVLLERSTARNCLTGKVYEIWWPVGGTMNQGQEA